MTDYSATPLGKKLGIKQGFKIYIKNSPCEYGELLNGVPEKVRILKRLSTELDMIHLFTKSRLELSAETEKYISSIRQAGMIWVSWPKKSSKVETDIAEGVIRDVALPLGLVDVKVCSVNDTWSGLKLVIRKEYRK